MQVVYVPYYYPAPPPPPPAPVFTPAPPPNAKNKAARAIDKGALLCFGQIAFSTAWAFAFEVILLALNVDPFFEKGLTMSLLTGATLVLSTGLIPFLFFVVARHKTVDYLKFQKVGFFSGLLCVLAGSALMLLANIPASFVREALEGTGYEATTLEMAAENGGWLGFAVDFVTIAVLGPMMEEIMDRGIILTSLRGYGLGFAAVVSGLLFGLNHLDLSTVVFATMAGIVLGFIYARTNNLWLTIWIHMINNGMATISEYGALFYPDDPELPGEILSTALLGLGLLSLILVLTWKRKMFMTRRSPNYDGPAQSFGVGSSLGAMVRSPLLWVFWLIVGAFFVVPLVM